MDPILEDTKPRPTIADIRAAGRRDSRVLGWFRGEIRAYRFGLTLGYFLVVMYGMSAFIAGVKTFTLYAIEGYTPVWAVALMVGGRAGLIGSLDNRKAFQITELVGTIFQVIPLAIYTASLAWVAISLNDNDRVQVAVGFLLILSYPTVRWIFLANKARSKVREDG